MNQQAKEGAWIEAITMFEQVRNGDYGGAAALLHSSREPDLVLNGLLRLLGLFFRGEECAKLEHFAETARKMGPPPALQLPPGWHLH